LFYYYYYLLRRRGKGNYCGEKRKTSMYNSAEQLNQAILCSSLPTPFACNPTPQHSRSAIAAFK